MRWWYRVSEQTGYDRWDFEYEYSETAIEKNNFYYFWIALYLHPLFWIVMAVVNGFVLSVFESGIDFAIGVLAFVNLMGYYKCRIHKIKNAERGNR